MEIVARYGSLIFRCWSVKLGTRYQVDFIDFFEGTDKEFIEKYRIKYPNYSFQIFMDKRKPLSRSVRKSITEYIKTPEFLQRNRDYNLTKLLG